MSTAGDRIRELRIRNKLTLDDVAKYLGVGRQAIYKYEHGTVTNIPLENIEKMAELFHVTPGYISGWSDEPERSTTMDLQLFGDPNSVSEAPATRESRIISEGIDRMPPERREQALKILQVAFSEFFKEDTE